MAERLAKTLAYTNPDPTDFQEGITVHRDMVVAADSGNAIPSLSPAGWSAAAFTDKDNVFHVNGAKNIEMCAFSTTAASTAIVTIKLWPHTLNLIENKTHTGRGISVYSATFTFSGNAFAANIHPITGNTVSPANTFREASAVASPDLVAGQVVVYEKATIDPHYRIMFDTHAYAHVYVTIGTVTGVGTDIVVGLRRVS